VTLIRSETELEDLLSRPSEADQAAVRGLVGDLLILGAGGKMGPSLARRARRAADQAGVAKRIMAVSRFSDRAAEKLLRESGASTCWISTGSARFPTLAT
jgi:hypothetical protein